MEANKRQIKDIFNQGRQLVVPFFQRTYVWEETQWERFVEDMEYLCQTEQNYFLGAIILKQQQTPVNWISDIRTIIDGQQRLTTLCIYMKALCLLTGKNQMMNRFKLTEDEENYNINAILHSKIDRKAFDDIMNLTDKDAIIDNKNEITKAFYYFLKKIDVNKVGFNAILKYVQFVVIDLNNDEDEQKIFDTINSGGISLSTGELLKNYFFKEDNKDDYDNIWSPIFEKDQKTIDFWKANVTTGRLKKNNLDNLLYYYLQIKLQDLKVPSEVRRGRYRRWDGLFDNYKTLMKDNGVSIENLINEISEYATIYKKYLNYENISSDADFNDSIIRINFLIWKMDCTTIIPYVLYVFKHIDENDLRTTLLEYLESYIVRRIFANLSNKSFSDLFCESLLKEEFLTVEGLKSYFKEREDQALAMPSDEDVIRGTYDHVWRNGKALAVLYLMETRLHTDRDSTKVDTFDHYSLEHLMPQTPIKWPIAENHSPEDRKKHIYMLGNMAMITSSLNSSISNGIWLDKLDGNSKYGGLKRFTSGLTLMEDVLQKSSWDEDCIKERSENLGRKAIELWKM